MSNKNVGINYIIRANSFMLDKRFFSEAWSKSYKRYGDASTGAEKRLDTKKLNCLRQLDCHKQRSGE